MPQTISQDSCQVNGVTGTIDASLGIQHGFVVVWPGAARLINGVIHPGVLVWQQVIQITIVLCRQ